MPEQYLPEIQAEMHQHPLKVEAAFQNMNVPPPQGEELTFINNTVDETTGTITARNISKETPCGRDNL